MRRRWSHGTLVSREGVECKAEGLRCVNREGRVAKGFDVRMGAVSCNIRRK